MDALHKLSASQGGDRRYRSKRTAGTLPHIGVLYRQASLLSARGLDEDKEAAGCLRLRPCMLTLLTLLSLAPLSHSSGALP